MSDEGIVISTSDCTSARKHTEQIPRIHVIERIYILPTGQMISIIFCVHTSDMFRHTLSSVAILSQSPFEEGDMTEATRHPEAPPERGDILWAGPSRKIERSCIENMVPEIGGHPCGDAKPRNTQEGSRGPRPRSRLRWLCLPPRRAGTNDCGLELSRRVAETLP